MNPNPLGKLLHDGEVLFHQGEPGDCMYVVQSGEIEIFREDGGYIISLRIVRPGEFFGEMALVEHDVRSASARACGNACLLTIDRRTFMRRVHEDPSLAFRVMESLAHQIRTLARELAVLKSNFTLDAGASTNAARTFPSPKHGNEPESADTAPTAEPACNP